jgi:E3 ubiquitin-protein ligase HECTD2
MAPKAPRPVASNPQVESTSTTGLTTTIATSTRQVRGYTKGNQLDVFEHTYGIPSLHGSGDPQVLISTKNPSKEDRPTSRHGRSMSHPFPSLFQSKGKRQAADVSSSAETHDHKDISQHFESPPKPAFGKPKRVPDKDLKTGKCMTCDSTVRWPKELFVFRCTVCLTINDLKSTSIDTGAEAGRDTSPLGVGVTTRFATSTPKGRRD